jgi:hypothetical protein
MTDKLEKICPYCARPIRGKNSSILEVNFALHTKKHELRGDSMDLSLPRKVASALSSSSFTAILIVVGYFVGGWAVANLYKIAWPWFYVGFTSVFASITTFVWFRTRQYLRRYLHVCRTLANWIFSIIVGTLVSNLVILIQGLFPYYQNPYVLILWGLYFMLIADMLFLQRSLGRASSIAMAISGSSWSRAIRGRTRNLELAPEHSHYS